MKSKLKISTAILTTAISSLALFNSLTTAEPVSELQMAQPAETITNQQSTINPNSGLNPGYSITPIQNTKPVPPNDKLPNMTATSAVVIEAKTGHIIYQRDAHRKMFPASTTKMMTLITALEYGNLDEIVTVSNNASGAEGSTLWLEVGEKIPLGDLLSGMMMISGNDAAIAIAEHVDGSVPKFAAHMTKRAKELGAKDTNFTNANGLPDENHYTTAYDLAILAAYGYSLDHFEEIVSTKEKIFPWVHDPAHLLRNENQMLWLYQGGNGVKTGYTDAAGRCLISASNRNGVQLIAVVLDSVYMWNDSIALLDYGFSKVENSTLIRSNETVDNVPIISGRKHTMPVKTTDEIVMPVFKDDNEAYKINYDIPSFLRAPIKKGDTVGKVRVLCDGQEVAETNVVATSDVEQKSFFKMILNAIQSFF
ncbi:MAG: D-alanyl-D-alanine carboxypeptidase [Selenomonadaceae bacterium]|nr:D-alanyl-D-alanine carboxypeptidase [Selenomonadaceae bacterium]